MAKSNGPSPRELAARRLVLRRARLGEMADLSKFKDPASGACVALAATFIRDLVCLGLPGVGARGARTRLPFGLSIKAARIEGTLDLREAMGFDGQGCAALVLEDCQLVPDEGVTLRDGFEEPFPSLDARHAQLRRLALRNCQVGLLDLSDAEICGDLELEGLAALAPGKPCWIRARDSVIQGSLRAAETKLSLEGVPARPDWLARPYALDLSGTRIEGNVNLRPGFEADGGINVSRCQFQSELWCDGAKVTARNNRAFFAQGTRVLGGTILRGLAREGRYEPFRSVGRFFFLGAKMLGGIDMTGAILEPTGVDDQTEPLLDFGGTTIERFLYLRRAKLPKVERTTNEDAPTELGQFVAMGTVRLTDSTVRGIVQIQGKLEKLTTDSSSVGTSVYLGEVSYPVEMRAGTTIEGPLDILGAGGSFSAPGLVVTGDLGISGSFKSPVDLRLARIAGSVTLDLELGDSGGPARSSALDLNLKDARVEGDLNVKRVVQTASPAGAGATPWAELEPAAVSMRSRELDSYAGWSLAEAMIPGVSGEVRLLSFLWHRTPRRRGWRVWQSPSTIETILLPGDSPPIHNLNRRGILDLADEPKRLEYLRFFCGHIWGEEGPFPIIESVDQVRRPANSKTEIPNPEPLTAIPHPEGDDEAGPWKFQATMLYGKGLFATKLVLKPDGMVEMEDDEPQTTVEDLLPVRYEKPARTYQWVARKREPRSWPVPPLVGDAGQWQGLGPELIQELWRQLVKTPIGSKRPVDLPRRVLVSLERSRVRALHDGRSKNWGSGVHVALNGFEYDSVDVSVGGTGFEFQQSSAPSRLGPRWARLLASLPGRRAADGDSEWRARLDWLECQVTAPPPLVARRSFSPQPFETLADRLRRQGEPVGAREVTLRKLVLQRKLVERFPSKLTWGLFEFFFGYALKPWRSVATFMACWLLGILVVDLANYGELRVPLSTKPGIRVLDVANPPEPVFVFDVVPAGIVGVVQPAGDAALALSPPLTITGDVPCQNRIVSAAYALGVFLPILELDQEARCGISTRPNAWPWRWAKAIYQLLGWVVTTLTLFTVGKRILSHLEKSGDSLSNG